MSEKVALGRKTLLIVFQYLIGSILGLICLSFAANYFSLEVVGFVVGASFSIFRMITFFSDFGLRQTHMNKVHSSDFATCNSSYLLSKTILTTIVTAIFLLIIFSFGTETVLGYETETVRTIFLLFLLCAILFTIRDIPVGIFDSKRETWKSQSIILTEHVSRLPLTVLFAFLAINKDFTTASIYLALTFVLSVLISSIYSLYLLKGYPFGKPKMMKDYFVSSPGIAFIGGIDIVVLNLDKIILIFIISAQDLGIYTGVNRIAQMIFFLSTALITILIPTISAQKDNEAVNSTHFAERYLSMIIIPLTFLAIAFRKELIMVVLKESFLGGEYTLIILLFAVLLLSISRSNAVLLFGRKKIRMSLYLNAILAAIYISGIILLSNIYGMNGAAIAMLIAGIFSFFTFGYSCKIYFGKKIFDKSLIKQFFAGGVMLLLTSFLVRIEVPDELHPFFLIFVLALGIIVYAAILIAERELRFRDVRYGLDLINGANKK
ncbi:MAG: Polysaccharide biosynthesis protein [Candidatus Methanolliviera sp. GoM_oil]|nr:MAG: Polysaccharide biosynthesis protein [Candidatus Methanolliviera sp. GoM_oil]